MAFLHENRSSSLSQTFTDLRIAATTMVAFSAAAAALVIVGAAVDKAMNPDLVATLKENWSWTRFFTSSHALTVLMDLYPIATTSIVACFGAAQGFLVSLVRR